MENQTTTEIQQAKKKVHYKFVKIKKSEIVEKTETKKANRFQRAVCWIIRVVPAQPCQYMVRIQYSGVTRLKKQDVVINKLGTQFLVANEENRYALLLSMPNLTQKPYIHEKMWVLPKSKRAIRREKKKS